MYDAVFSAPGKALLAGGYLVLLPEFSAFSVALSSRMYVAISKPTDETTELIIASPQFVSEWHYPSKIGTHTNPFLNACYDAVSRYFGRDLSGKITIFSDDGFHSQQNAKPNHFHKKFSNHAKNITQVPKTGLGSSAALVVAVVAALTYLGGDIEINLSRVHSLAQIAHSSAQGKIGSGFDVATAVYGTILYSRFDPNCVPKDSDRGELVKAVDTPWQFTAERCEFSSRYEILMGDVAQGSETPGMVKRVLQWRSEHPAEAEALFSRLNEANMRLFTYMAADKPENPTNISTTIHKIRTYLRELGECSGVPIEPPRQTDLLNRASEVPGVLGGVVPGAGGDDAICLVLDTTHASKSEILTQLQVIEGVTWMDNLSLESNGLITENTANFEIN